MDPKDSAAIADLAHLIQNQLSLITGHASILHMDGEHSADELQSLARIQEAALMAGELVRELAEISMRLSRGQ